MKHRLTALAAERKRRRAGLDEALPPNRAPSTEASLESLQARVQQIFNIVQRTQRPASNMIFFVMYDIESNKVRTLVSKYLLGKGCTRIQRSIFLADLSTEVFETIKTDLAEVQAAYDNNDSILIVPVPCGYLDAMKIIGQEINIDLITHTRNTLFL